MRPMLFALVALLATTPLAAPVASAGERCVGTDQNNVCVEDEWWLPGCWFSHEINGREMTYCFA